MIRVRVIAVILVICLCFCSCSKKIDNSSSGAEENASSGEVSIKTADTSSMDFEFTDRDKTASYDKTDVTSIELNNSAKTEITSGGTYILSGSIENKTITVSAADTDKVQIVLDGVNINNQKGPAIYIKSADKVFITLKDGTKNTISDGSSYTYTDGDSEVDAAIFSRADLTFNGSGSLILTANNKHGIVSKDDLVITSGSYNITSKNVSINGKDCVKIGGGEITANAGTDAIRSDNSEDADRGFVYIEDGKLNLTAANDGIQAETVIKASGGEITIVSGGGSSKYSQSASESCKGLKAVSDIQISGGSFNINSLDDSIHSNNTITISDGSFTLKSGDDGIHADNDLAISGGKILISESYEGLESSRIILTDGETEVTASDDGINAAGGNDSGEMRRGPFMDNFSNGVGEIIISGGYHHIDASGDGIDSNGTITVSGGITLVSGPTNNGNGSFDYDTSASVSGGVLIALGSSGMAQGFSSAQNQGAILTSISSQSGGTAFALCDKNGKAIVSFTPDKAYSSAIITAPEIQSGNTYYIITGGSVSGADKNGFAQNASQSGGTTLLEIEMTSSLYSTGGGMHGGMPGGMPGGEIPGGMPGGRPGGHGGFMW